MIVLFPSSPSEMQNDMPGKCRNGEYCVFIILYLEYMCCCFPFISDVFHRDIDLVTQKFFFQVEVYIIKANIKVKLDA